MQPDNQSQSDGWAFRVEGEENSGAGAPPPPPATPQADPISWTGSEFLDKHKNGSWYLALFGAIAVVCGFVFVVSRDWLSVGFISVMGILFAVIASRKPRQLSYSIDRDGLHIGNRSYSFGDFKSFSLKHEGVIGYISLLPLKRLHPEIAIYYPPNEEQRIFDALSARIPNEDHKDTLIDKFSRFIRF